MKKKRLVAFILVALMLVTFSFTGCGSSESADAPGGDQTGASAQFRDIENEELKIAFIPLSTSGVACATATRGFETAIAAYPNIKLQVFDPQYDPSKQVTMINECITQQYDAIIIEPMDPETVGNAIVEAEKEGIPVLALNLQVSTVHTVGVKGSDYMAGQVGAEELCKALNDQGNVVILDAPAAQMTSTRHSLGFKDWLEQNNKTGINILDYQNIEAWSLDNAHQVMRDLITKHGDAIDAVFAASDDLALGAVQAITGAGKTGEILVWGCQGFPNALQAIKDGTMYGTSRMDDFVQCHSAMLVLLNHIQTGTTAQTAGYTQTPIVQTGAFACTKENVDEYL
ncbi:MAG: sugar ABC transporter substrate-binding protein [Peptococcaceae bacterium]|nr:sugar ABC transporter substrate-binding protein [Peptococcaceae bacterium]